MKEVKCQDKIKGNVEMQNVKIEKNMEFVTEIHDITSDGEGVGHVNDYTLFIKDAVVGDKIRVKVLKTKKNYGYGRIMEILVPSPYRVVPKCAIARQCGGCQLQHLDYGAQLKYKENKVKNCLERIGKLQGVEEKLEPIIGMEEPYYYRNKAQFPVGKDKDGQIIMGFYAGRTHSIMDTEHCYIQAPVNETLLSIVRKFMEEFNIQPYDEETQQGLVRHVLTRVGFKTGEIMVCLVVNGKKLSHSDVLVERLREVDGMTSISLNVNREKTNVILGKEIIWLWGQEYITDYIGDVKYQISPLSFYQVNPQQTRRLYETALEFAGLTGNEVVWDLYCGIGTISLFLAQKAKQVYGVEIVPEAIEDAKRNAQINGIGNVTFFAGAAEEVLPEKYRESNGAMKADVIVVDPPRKGCDERLLETVVNMEPEKVVYVSCDPATLARDLRFMEDRGYEVKRVRACDMFPHSVHTEIICLLGRAGNLDK